MTLARKLIFTSVRTDGGVRAQHFANFTFHRILQNVMHRGSVNLRTNSIPVSVTLIRLVDIYLLLDKINSILKVPIFNTYNVHNQNFSISHYYWNVDCDTQSEYFHLGWNIYLDVKSSVLIKIVSRDALWNSDESVTIIIAVDTGGCFPPLTSLDMQYNTAIHTNNIEENKMKIRQPPQNGYQNFIFDWSRNY